MEDDPSRGFNYFVNMELGDCIYQFASSKVVLRCWIRTSSLVIKEASPPYLLMCSSFVSSGWVDLGNV